MKLRKSKSDIGFRIDYSVHRIDYSVQALGVVTLRPKTSVRDTTWFREEMVWTRQTPVFAEGHSRGSVLRGFLHGRDRNNIRIDRCVAQSRVC